MQRATELDHRVLLEDIGKLLALVALLLPAAGVLVRMVFVGQYSVGSGDVAVRAPLAELSLTGVLALAPGLLTIAVPIALMGRYAPLFVLPERSASLGEKGTLLGQELAQLELKMAEISKQVQNDEAPARSRWSWITSRWPTQRRGDEAQIRFALDALDALDAIKARSDQYKAQVQEFNDEFEVIEAELKRFGGSWIGRLPFPPILSWIANRRWASRAVSGFYWGLLALFIPGWPTSWIGFGTSLLAYLVTRRLVRRSGRLAVARLWWVIVFALLAYSVAAGLQGNLPGVFAQTVTLRPAQRAVGLHNGTYEHVGDDANTYYFLTCGGKKHQLVAVQRDQVLVAVSKATRDWTFGPSLFTVIFLRSPVHLELYGIC